MENSMEVPQNTKERATIGSSNPTPRYISKENKNNNSERYMHPNVHCSTIYNSQDMEATEVISRGINKHTYTQWNITQS